MAVSVVEGLEVIDVQHHERQGASVAHATLALGVEVFVEAAPVVEASQSVHLASLLSDLVKTCRIDGGGGVRGEHFQDFDGLDRRVSRFGMARLERAYDARSHDERYR